MRICVVLKESMPRLLEFDKNHMATAARPVVGNSARIIIFGRTGPYTLII